MIHKALEMAQPGDVIVVDGGGDLTNSLIGELMTIYAQRRGVAGFVIHGAIRGLDIHRCRDFPGLCRRRYASRPLQGRPRRDQRAHRH